MQQMPAVAVPPAPTFPGADEPTENTMSMPAIRTMKPWSVACWLFLSFAESRNAP